MLGRQVGTSLLRLPCVARLPLRSLPLCRQQQRQYDLAVRTLTSSAARCDTDAARSRPGRPKKAVGEPSRPVRRDVKRASKSAKDDAATKQLKARKAATQKKKKKAAAAKKKPLTEEQKERLAARKARRAEKLRKASASELKKAALKPPSTAGFSAWNSYIRENNRLQGAGSTKEDYAAAFRESMHRMKDEFHNLTPADREHYNHLAHTAREEALAAYKRYVESHTVEDIETANRARKKLQSKVQGQSKKWPPIKDERRVKQPPSPYILFSMSRRSSDDFKGISTVDTSRLIGREWKALSEDEKKRYQKLYDQEKETYKEAYTSIHGYPPGTRSKRPAAAAT